MQKTFEDLRGLQAILIREFGFEEELEEIPRELNELKRSFHKLDRSIQEKESTGERNSTLLEELKKEKEELQSGKEKYESQIELIKTQREYEALTSEIAQINERLEIIGAAESEALQELENIEGDLEEQRTLLGEMKKTIAEKEKEVNKLLAAKKKELDGCLKEKKKITHELDEELIYKFEKIVRNKEGIGIVSIKNNVCMGCNMLLPPQFVNDVRREEKIIFCPNCSRILFYMDEADQPEDIVV